MPPLKPRPPVGPHQPCLRLSSLHSWDLRGSPWLPRSASPAAARQTAGWAGPMHFQLPGSGLSLAAWPEQDTDLSSPGGARQASHFPADLQFSRVHRVHILQHPRPLPLHSRPLHSFPSCSNHPSSTSTKQHGWTEGGTGARLHSWLAMATRGFIHYLLSLSLSSIDLPAYPSIFPHSSGPCRQNPLIFPHSGPCRQSSENKATPLPSWAHLQCECGWAWSGAVNM